MIGLLGNWHQSKQTLNPSLWGEPVFGSIHVQDISTTHTVTLAGGSSRPSSPTDRRQTSPPLVSPVSTQSPPNTRMCTRSSQIGINLLSPIQANTFSDYDFPLFNFTNLKILYKILIYINSPFFDGQNYCLSLLTYKAHLIKYLLSK